jgi:HEAT repeat protein
VGLVALVVIATVFLLLYGAVSELVVRRRAIRLRPYQDLADLMALGEVGATTFVRATRPRARRQIEAMLAEIADHFTGEVTEHLTEAFVALGAVDRAIKQAGAFFWWQRAQAARRLGMYRSRGRAVTHALNRLLQDRHPEVRMAAARALVELHAHDLLPEIVGTMADVQTFSVLRMADIILEAGPPAIPALIAFLRRPAPVRAHAVALEQLGALRALEAEELICAALKSPEKDLRASACRALGAIESLAAEEALIAALTDPAWEVRAQAAKALGAIGDPEAVPHLLPLLKESEWWVLYHTARSLVALGQVGAVAEALARDESRYDAPPVRRRIFREVLATAEWR